MKCDSHPDRESVAQCALCGKNLCNECTVIMEDRTICLDCLKKGEHVSRIQSIALPVLICGVIMGLLLAPQMGAILSWICCWEIGFAGAAAVALFKCIDETKGKIPTEKAALVGGLTGLVASITVWIAVWIGVFLRPSFEKTLIHYGITVSGDALPVVVYFLITAILFTFVGGLGGIISNEVIKKPSPSKQEE